MEKIPCQSSESCPLYNSATGCFEDVHHKYWPRKAYRSIIERAFRELDDNKERRCRQSHNDLHAMTPPPDKPPRAEMINAVNLAKTIVKP